MELQSQRLSLRIRWFLLLAVAPTLSVLYFLGQTTYLFWQSAEQRQQERIVEFEQNWGPLLALRVEQEIKTSLYQVQQVLRFFDYTNLKMGEGGAEAFAKADGLAGLFVFSGAEYRSILSLNRQDPHREGGVTVEEVLLVSGEKVDDTLAGDGILSRVIPRVGLVVSWKRGSLSYVAHFAVNTWFRTIREHALDMTIALLNRQQQVVFVVNEPQDADLAPVWAHVQTGVERSLASVGGAVGDYYVGKTSGFYSHYLMVLLPVPKWYHYPGRLLRNHYWLPLLALLILLFVIFVPFYRTAHGIGDISYVLSRSLQGNFDVRCELQGKDEVSWLGQALNKVLEKMSLAMTQLAQKIRLESELSTAKSVQATLFPEPNFENSRLSLSGRSLAASETSGDWWYYSEVGERVFMWLGDATGHGASAALLTSAARAVAAVIEYNPNISPAQALRLMNRAIYDTSKGQMMMTFFVASFDLKRGVLSYANASHDPPFKLADSNVGVAKAKDFEPLFGVNNPRLGENRDLIFKEASLKLKKGDRLIFYTDGVIDVADPMGKCWGERRFLNALNAAFASSKSAAQNVEDTFRSLHQHRQNAPLDDDMTLIVVRWEGANE